MAYDGFTCRIRVKGSPHPHFDRFILFTKLPGHKLDHLNNLLRLLSPALVFLCRLLHGPVVVAVL